jgi:mannose-6-phosphate isomerase class I
MKKIPFQIVDWNSLPKTISQGETGRSISQKIEYPGLRIRIIEYSDEYLADHWCQKGHIVYCIEGEVINEQENGEQFILKQGMSYVVTDEMSSHRSRTKNKVKLLIVDGDFLISD